MKDKIKKYEKYKCENCGYIFDPRVGEPAGGILPNTDFENLLKWWICPRCGSRKDQFKILK